MNESAIKIDRVSESAIGRLVDDFYVKVRADPELGQIFERAIAGDWEPHLTKMREFWSSVMLKAGRYKGNPVAAHLHVAGIDARLFDRWLELFGETCGELFDDSLAGEFCVKAARIAASLKLALFYRPVRPPSRIVP